MQHTEPPTRPSSREALLRQIEAAFGDVKLGGGVSLHQADAIDDYESPEEIARVRALDTEERWQDIPDEKLLRFPSVIPFFDAEGFRFYFPRFMTFALFHPKSESAVPDTAIYWAEECAHECGLSALLNNEQWAAVRAFAAFHAEST